MRSRRPGRFALVLALSAILVPVPAAVSAQVAPPTAPAFGSTAGGATSAPSAGPAATGLRTTAVPAAVVAPPSSPIVTGQPGSGKVTFRWAAAVTHGSAVKAYQVQTRHRSRGSWSSWSTATLPASSRSRAVTAANGTPVEGRVRATSGAGTGAWSAAQDVEAGTPTAPGALTATPGYLKLAIGWGASNGNGSTVTGYQVRSRAYANGSWGAWTTTSLSASARSKSWTGLGPGQHQTQIRGINHVGAGPWTTARTSRVEGPAVKLGITVSAGTSPLAARNVTVTALDAGGGPAHTYRGTVTFARMQGTWDIPSDAIPVVSGNEAFDVEGVIPGDYAFTDVDNGAHTFVGGWYTDWALPWGLAATDTTTASITGKVRIDVPAEVRVAGGQIEAIASWQSSANVTPVLNGTWRDPRVNGATIEFYDAGAPDATSLPGSGGRVVYDLPKEGWTLYHPTGGGFGYGYEYTGDGSTGCSDVKVAILTITANCTAGSLTLPFSGGLQMWLQLGQESAGPAFFCPQFAGAERVTNTASVVDGRAKAWWTTDEGSLVSSCLTAVEDDITVVNPMSGIAPAVLGGKPWGSFNDEFSVNILSNDTAANHAVLSWSLDHTSPGCTADANWLGGWRCGFTTAGATVPAARARWFQIIPPDTDPGPLLNFTTQPDCGYARHLDYGPSTGTYDASTGVECTFDDTLSAPYSVTDGLHTARGTIVVTYDNPGHPDTSSFDTSTVSIASYDADSLNIQSDASSTGTIVLPLGLNIPVVEFKPTAVPNVITGTISIQCSTCDDGIVVGTMDLLQPSLAAAPLDPTTGILEIPPSTILTRRTTPLVISGLPDSSSPFAPVVTTRPDSLSCTTILSCGGTQPGANASTLPFSFNVFTLADTCIKTLGGTLVEYGPVDDRDPNLKAWDCTLVKTSASQARDQLGGFCTQIYQIYTGFLKGPTYGGQLTSPAPTTWSCRYSPSNFYNPWN